MRHERKRESNVVVEVLDLSEIQAAALAYANDRLDDGNEPWDEVSTYGGAYGRAFDSDGNMFILNTEGVGGSKPVSKEHPVFIEFHASRKTDEGTVGTMLPVATAEMHRTDFANVEVMKEVNLADFIRSFGARLESNFDSWNRVLTEG
jgi:hypothetical protein